MRRWEIGRSPGADVVRALAVSVVAVAALGVLGAVVVAGDDPTSVRAGEGDDPVPAGDPVEEPDARSLPGPVAETLDVACGAGGSSLELGARRVRTRPGGVPVSVVVPDDGTSVEVTQTGVRRAGAPVWEGVYETGDAVLERIAPGRALVRCYPDAGPRHTMGADEDPAAVAIEIVDADGHWKAPRELECESGLRQNTVVDYAAPAGRGGREAPPKGSPVDVARQDLPVSPGDTLEAAGYAEGRARVVEVVRDGRVVISGRYTLSQGSWLLGGYEACGDR